MNIQNNEPILRVQDLKKVFGSSLAVDGISFDVFKGRTFCLAGESGSGKTTLARMLADLIPATSGEVLFLGQKKAEKNSAQRKLFRKSVQIVFQDPFASLNPRLSIAASVTEPLIIQRMCKKHEITDRAKSLLMLVGLPEEYVFRYPHEISGGECQRVCIARALSVEPEVIILDEPLSSLDFSVQRKIQALLLKLKQDKGLTYIFITHDLRLAREMSDDILVMKNGRSVEAGTTQKVLSKPSTDYVKELIESAV